MESVAEGIKIVLDTNIYISALIIPGSRAEKAIAKIIDEHYSLVISKEIISEILHVLARKFSRNREELSRVAVSLSDLSEVVTPKKKLNILADEADNRILECAIEGDAHFIVTGDKAMLSLKEYKGIRVISLNEFLV